MNFESVTRRRVAVFLIAVSGVLAGRADAGEPPLRVGVLTELTGPLAASGVYVRKSVEAFAKAANAKGGIEGHPVEVVVIDTQSKPELAVAGLRRLANDDLVDVVLCCGNSPTSIVVKPVSKQLKIPVIAAGQAAEVIQPPDQAQWIFRPNVSQETALRLQLQAIKQAGIKNVAYLGVNNAFGTYPAKLLDTLAPEYGLVITGTQLFEVTAIDVKSQLALLRAGKPDALIVWAVGPPATLVSKNVQELAMTARIYHSGGAANAEFIRDGGSAVDGNLVSATISMVPIQSLPTSDPAYGVAKAYNEAWMTLFGTTGDEFGRSMWDGMNLVSLAMKAKKPDLTKLEDARAKIRDGLEEVHGFAGLAGTYNMSAEDHSGLGSRGGAMLEVKGGKFVLAQ